MKKVDYILQTKFDSWVALYRHYHTFFNEDEIGVIRRSERSFDPRKRIVVQLAFENKFVSLGGLGTVMRQLPNRLAGQGEKVVFITPFHRKHPTIKKAFAAGLFTKAFEECPIRLCGFEGVLNCYKDTTADFPSFYIDIDNHFTAGENPYAYKDEEKLCADALAFSAAVPFTLNKLGLNRHVILHAHDWEAAAVALTSKMAVISGLLHHARTLLTLHNSFDNGIPEKMAKRFFGKSIPYHTILQYAIPFLNGPLTTVSVPFSYELRYDSLQRGVFADHLQQFFSYNSPIGIENGLFGNLDLPYNQEDIELALSGKISKIMRKKNRLRKHFMTDVLKKKDSRIKGRWHFDVDREFSGPLLFLSGRFDLSQKGFDVLFHAFRRLPRGSAKLFFCPSSCTKEHKEAFRFFEEVQQECEGDITIWPFRISGKQYRTFLQGASFLVMPSMYEPFGAATEGMLAGTPVIARATGGLYVQVRPLEYPPVPEFYRKLFDNGSCAATGILYHEEMSEENEEALQWRRIFSTSPFERIEIPLYSRMVDAAYNSLLAALDIFSDKQTYMSLILNGIRKLDQFSWDSAIEKYQRVYDIASYRGV